MTYLNCLHCGLRVLREMRGDGFSSCDCPRCDLCNRPDCDCWWDTADDDYLIQGDTVRHVETANPAGERL